MSSTTPPLTATEVRVLSRLLDRALALQAAEREAWLAALPAAQQPLVPRLRDRLQQLAPPPPGAASPPPLPKVAKADSRQGEPVGPYRLQRPLGDGKVWLVEEAGAQPAKPLALRLESAASAAAAGSPSRPPQPVHVRMQPREPHPQIVQLRASGRDALGRAYRVMPYIEGVDLMTHARRRRLSTPQCLQLMRQVCAVVTLAEARRNVCSELGPSSWLVDDEGRVRLLDWGTGPPLHPEAAAADVHVLGRVLQQLLLRHAVDADLQAVLQRALHADPGQRYADAGALADDLQRLLELRPVQAALGTPWHRAGLLLRRRPVVAAAAAVALLVVVFGASLLWRQETAGREQQARAALARSFVADALEGADPLGTPTVDAAVQGQRVQTALVRARAGFAGEPLLRGVVLAELAQRYRALGQHEQALDVLREALALMEKTAAPGDPALTAARTQLAALRPPRQEPSRGR